MGDASSQPHARERERGLTGPWSRLRDARLRYDEWMVLASWPSRDRGGWAAAASYVIVLVGGCGDSLRSNGEYMDEDFPPLSCDTEATTTGCATSTGEPVAACQVSTDCSVGVCVADFSGDIGRFECRDACIEALDEARWCADASACCDAAAICDRGLCMPPAGSTTGESGETSTAGG